MLSNKKNIDYAFRALKHRHRLDQHQICSVFATQFSPYSKKSNDPINKDDKKKEEKCSPPKINVVGFIKPTVHDPYRITIKDIEVKPIKMTSIKYARSVLYLSKRRKNPLAKSKSLPVINPYRNLLMMWLMQSLTFDFFGRKGSDGNRKGSDSSRNDSDIEKPRVEENYDKEQENKPSDERGGTNAGYYQTSSNYYFSNPYDVNYSNWATYNDKMNKNSQNQPQYYQNAGKQYDPYNYWNNYYQQFDQNNQYHGGYGNMMHGQQQTQQQAQQQQAQQQQAQQHQSQQQQQVQQQQMQQHQQQMQQKQQQIQQQMQQQMQKQMQQQQKMQQQMQQQQKLQQQKMQQHQQQMQQQPQQYQQTQSYQQTQQYQQPHQYQQAQHYQQAQQYKHAQQYHQTQQCQPPQTQVPQPQAQNQHYYTYPQYQFNQQQQGQGQGQGQTQNQNNQQPQSPHPNYTPPRVDNIYNHYGWYQNPYVNPFATNAFMTNRMVNMSRQNNNSNSNMTETHEAEIPNWMRHRYETDPNVNRNFWKYDETGLKRAESDSELSKKSDQDYQAEGDSQRRDASGDRQDEKHSDSSDYKSKWQQASDRSIDSSSKDSTTRQIDNIINLGPPESQTDGSAPTKTDGMTASQRLQEKVSTELFKTGRTTTSPQDSKSRH